jgi:hypothetical protein
MNVQRRNFLFVGTLAAAVAAITPTLGQSLAPAGGPDGGGTQSATSIPDFSGIWAHPSGNSGFEPLPSGPSPVMNRSRYDGLSDAYQYVGDYTNPILKPEAAEVVKKHGEIESSGLAYPTPSTRSFTDSIAVRRLTPAPSASVSYLGMHIPVMLFRWSRSLPAMTLPVEVISRRAKIACSSSHFCNSV